MPEDNPSSDDCCAPPTGGHLMLLLQTGIVLVQGITALGCLHSERGVWLSCNARKPANPPAWLLSEQQADVSICQKYAALCKNIEEVKNGLSG